MEMEGALIDNAIGALRDAPHLLKYAHIAALVQHADAPSSAWALRLVVGATLRAHPACQLLTLTLIELPVSCFCPGSLLIYLSLYTGQPYQKGTCRVMGWKDRRSLRNLC
jgi:hypothetical protein